MDSNKLRVSVVVPTYNRPDLLERCLFSLLMQSLPAEEYEILVCDDGPSEAAEAVVRSVLENADRLVAVHYLPVTASQGPAGARNVGWRNAKAPVIAFTDDDTLPSAQWLQSGLNALVAGVDAVTGSIQMPLPERFSDYERDAARLEEAEFVTANCFLRRDVLQSVGGFDERYTRAWREDSDLHFALLQGGYRIVHDPRALVVHPLREAPFAASIRAQRKIMFDVLLYKKYPQLYRQRIRRGPPWFYLSVTGLLLLAVIAALTGIQRVVEAALILWAVLTFWFFWRRLSLSFLSVRNVIELVLSSIVIPPLSIFWRLAGALRFGWRLP